VRRVGPGFFAQNRRLVILGGLGLLLVAVGFGGLVFGGVTHLLKGSWPYTTGVARAVADPRVQQALGSPVVPGWMVTGSLKGDFAAGSTARLAVPLEGASRPGTLRIAAHARSDVWELDLLRLELEGAPSIDLLQP
jgi:hypothetical protein